MKQGLVLASFPSLPFSYLRYASLVLDTVCTAADEALKHALLLSA